MRKTFCILFALACSLNMMAQELKCTVTINSDKIEGSSKQVFNTLKTSIEEYMNKNRWTNMTFAEHEKIECSMLIVVSMSKPLVSGGASTYKNRKRAALDTTKNAPPGGGARICSLGPGP